MVTATVQPSDGLQPVTIEGRLEETRRRLLDLTRRNRLLNHRSTGRATIRMVDESPAEIFRLLVTEGKTLQFLSREEAPRDVAALVKAAAAEDGAQADGGSDAGDAAGAASEAGIGLAPIDAGADRAARQTDHNLQTALSGDKLQAQLIHLARESASGREEQGCNILFLVLGIVEWREADRGPSNRAPLLFIPVDLQRSSVNSRYSVRLFEDDIVVNPNLFELCRRMFHFELPAAEVDESFDLDGYFASVVQALSAMPGWRFLPEMHIGLFSFAKLLMYRDLDPANWPPARRLSIHPVVRRLSGFEADVHGDGERMPESHTLDETVRPIESFEVVDADSSQQVAILAAKRGMSAVIEGPPGTGKSQTITNIIAESLADGKTVLFVAEKSAALSVVKRRLEAVGLGDYVLELHSHKASKRAVLDELQRTLNIYEQNIAVGRPDATELESSRQKLNTYARDLHTPIGELALAPFEAIGRALELQDAPEAQLPIPDPLSWSEAQLRDARDQLDAFDRWRARVGDADAHPWTGAGLTTFDTLTRQRVQQSLLTLATALREADAAAGQLAQLLQLSHPATAAAAEVMLGDARALLQLPRLAPGVIANPGWNRDVEARAQWLQQGARRAWLLTVWSPYLVREAERQDWAPLLERRRQHNASLLGHIVPTSLQDRVMRRFSQPWSEDSAAIERYVVPGAQLPFDKQTVVLQALVESAALRSGLLAGVNHFADLFGVHWQQIDGSWDELSAVAEAAAVVRRLVERSAVRQEAARQIVEAHDRSPLSNAIAALEQGLARVRQAWSDWYAVIVSDEARWLGSPWQTTPVSHQLERVTHAQGSLEQLEDWIQFQAILASCANGPLHPFVSWALGRATTSPQLQAARAFARQFYHLWIDAALQRTSLRDFRGDDHRALIERFQNADKRWIEISRKRVAGAIRARMPSLSHEAHRQSKLGIVRAEMRKKRRHMPLRRLLSSAGDVIQTLKPCFMMSPISIAQYLSPGQIEFDLVIFDEASQVEPADAYGAIARGKQVLLVGDEKQLPPTNFFNKIEADGEVGGSEQFAVGDLESILSLGVVQLRHQCALRWHYRSRHASLIEFSNQRFYEGNLRIFPGPYTSSDEYGLIFRHVPNGVYLRGAGQYNPVEARAVAQEALDHAIRSPHLTLGIGAFSAAQQRAIEDEVERLRRTSTDPRVEAYFARGTSEPFFVKNLETIQGDERDVVLLSVGYGPDEHGKITMNFGPLNREGGWRRLNVLVTRARQRCVLFSSVRADQLSLAATQARGIVALKEYLHLAEHGRLAQSPIPGGDFDSPFEASVCQALRNHGWEVHIQVGSAGFFVDLAVVDPDNPGRYLLGIECDGATYHSSPTARDRDRLRQQVLEGLGWTIHRVWSTDWFRRPEATLNQILARLDALRNSSIAPRTLEAAEIHLEGTPRSEADDRDVRPEERVEPDEPDAQVSDTSKLVSPYGTSALRRAYGGVLYYPNTHAAFSQVIVSLVADESPIHVEEAQRVVASFFGVRAAKRFQEQFDDALQVALQAGSVIRRDPFLWKPDMQMPVVRARDGDCPVTKAELIAPEEFREAIRATLTREFGIRRADLITSTSRLLGYKRCGSVLESSIVAAIDALIQQKAIRVDPEGFLTLTP